MEVKKLKDLKQGDFFTLHYIGENPDERFVFVRGEYDRSARKYCTYKFTDVNHEVARKGDKLVYTGFTF